MVEEEKKIRHQCQRCCWISYERPKKCPECGCPMLREVYPGEPIDVVDDEAVKHFKTKLENCVNYFVDPTSKQKSYHKLQLRLERQSDQLLIKLVERCKTCGYMYSVHAIPKTRTDVLDKLK